MTGHTIDYQADWPSIFGPLISAGDVEGWAMALIRKWFSTYLAEVERQHGLSGTDLPRLKGWAIGPSWDKWPEDQLPAVLVSSPGTTQQPARSGDGGYTAVWTIEPGVVCSANTQEESHALAMLYGLAVRALFIQRPALDAGAAGLTWLGVAYDDLGYDDSRSLYVARNQFAVQVDNVTFGNAGPLAPDQPSDDPWADWPIATLVESTVINTDDPEGGTDP